jgi:hypothetical protein
MTAPAENVSAGPCRYFAAKIVKGTSQQFVIFNIDTGTESIKKSPLRFLVKGGFVRFSRL